MTMMRFPAQTPESDAAATVLCDRYRQQAELLVRHIKDQAYEDAVLLLVSRMLGVHTEAQHALLSEVKTRLAHIDELMEPLGTDLDRVGGALEPKVKA